MAKGQKRSNRKIRKPKQAKALSPAVDSFAGQIELAATVNGPRRIASSSGPGRIAVKACRSDDHYGRRVEVDRSWTVYDVFTGVPATIGGHAMVGLSRQAATERMLAMNRNSGGRTHRTHLDPPRLDAGEIGVLGWR